MYYNTTNEQGKTLETYLHKSSSQDEKIKALFKDGKHKLGASMILPMFNCPITSIRRSLNTLMNDGYIEKLDYKLIGLYGRKESVYQKVKHSVNPPTVD